MKILLTRPKSRENKNLKEELKKEFGVNIDIVELVKLKPIYRNLARVLKLIDCYDYIVFTSQNGVEIFFEYLKKRNKEVDFGNRSFVAIGPRTAEKLKSFVNNRILIPKFYHTQSLRKLLREIGKKCLVLRSLLSTPLNLPNVKEIYIYTLVPINKKYKKGFYDYVILTSSFITKVFFEKFEISNFKFFVPLGPVTYSELIKYVSKDKIIDYPEFFTIKDVLKKLINIIF